MEVGAEEAVDYFTSINNDCIRYILELLPVEELGMVGDTCKTLRIVATDVFKRKFTDQIPKWATITAQNYTITIDPDHLKHFIHCATNIHINDNYCQTLTDACEEVSLYLQRDFGDNVKSVTFSKIGLNETFVHEVKRLLENVELVHLSGCYGQRHIFDELVQHCKRIKQLAVTSPVGNMLPCYLPPTIESFECSLDNVDNVDELNVLFGCNPNVKQFTCHFNFDIETKKIAKWTEAIIANGMRCEKVFYNFQGFVNLALIEQALIKLIESETILHVAVKIGMHELSDVAVLKSLRSLSELHLYHRKEFYSSFPIAARELGSFDNLKMLFLSNEDCLNEVSAQRKLHQMFPNLVELYLIGNKPIDIYNLRPLIKHLSKLKKIVLHGKLYAPHLLALHLLALFEERLNAVCAVTIYLDEKCKPQQSFENGNDLFQIKWVKFSSAEGVDIVNPLYPYLMEEI